MKFTPKPENDFREFIDTYYQRCKEVCPKLRGLGGKWIFEDLIPGLSDFDTRLFFVDDVSTSDWSQMSIELGKVHTQLAIERPDWARKLEHNPGQNLTQAEMLDPVLYNPEAKQWTFYKGCEETLQPMRDYLSSKPWCRRDEIFFLKKISIFYGRYNRTIDKAVNVGKWGNKYPLHSRFMHYFTPPVQAAVSLVKKKTIRGKSDSLRQAREVFPSSAVIDMIFEAVEKHYEIPEYYQEPKLTQIEDMLEKYLKDMYLVLKEHVTLIKVEAEDTPESIREKVSEIPIDSVEEFTDGTRFGRLMKGRLQFYATQIPWFDTDWLIPNEVNRMAKNFYDRPLKAYAIARWHKDMSPETVLERLRGSLFNSQIAEGVKKFVSISRQPLEEDKMKERAAEMAEFYEPIQVMMETLRADLYKLLKNSRAKGSKSPA